MPTAKVLHDPSLPTPPTASTAEVPPPRPGLARDLLSLLRPGQWAKNLAVVPLALLETRAWHAESVGRIALAVALFIVASSIVYVLNDICDRHRDRRHPVKRLRPIAAERVAPGTATALACALAGLLAAGVVALPAAEGWPVLAYLVLNLGYSLGLKNVPLLDVFIVSIGFVLRLIQGYLVIGEEPSGWLGLCVFSLCLLLILGKRRHEIATSNPLGGATQRPALRGYTLSLVDQLICLAAVLTVVAYVLFLNEAHVNAELPHMAFLSVPFAVFGLARYLQVLLVEYGGSNPVRALFRDRITMANTLLWLGLLGSTLAFVPTSGR